MRTLSTRLSAGWIATAVFASLVAVAPAEEAAVLVEEALAPWTGDLDGIEERGYLRVGIPNNPLFAVYDGDRLTGLSVERMREFEKHLAETAKIDIDAMFITLPRDDLLDALIEGRVDMVDANLTVTEERGERVAFTDPLRTDVREIVVTGPGAEGVQSFDDLAGIGLHLRPSSSYFAHLAELNAGRTTPIPVTEADERLEDRDLLEMVNGGLIPAIVVDDHKARLWDEIFDSLTLHDDLAIHEGGQTAWAVRSDSPELKRVLDGFVAVAKEGTLLGNILRNRYLRSTEWVEAIDTDEEVNRYLAIRPIVQKHAEDHDLDWLMVIAQGYQESRLDQSVRSKAGAVGVMQVLPTTAADPNVGVDDIHEVDGNVEAGVKYLRFLRERYFSDPGIEPFEQVLLSLAAYNAGPANIARAREQAEARGLDPNVWFDNVEIVAGETISREPVTYVRNIYKYAVYVRLRAESFAAAEAARAASPGPDSAEPPQ